MRMIECKARVEWNDPLGIWDVYCDNGSFFSATSDEGEDAGWQDGARVSVWVLPKRQPMPESPITFRSPPEYAAAYRAAAEKAGVPLGRWINEQLVEALPKSVRKTLPEQRTPGRPKSSKDDDSD